MKVEGTSGKGTLRTEDGEDKPVSVQVANLVIKFIWSIQININVDYTTFVISELSLLNPELNPSLLFSYSLSMN